MALTIQNNIMALTAANNLARSYNGLSKSINRLSSGLRINGAADDAAGLAVRELMRSDVEVLNQGIRNANDAISMLQTMDGAASVIDEKLIRMKELAEQAATGTYSTDQRQIMHDEFAAMRDEIERIAQATEFNGTKMLDGTVAASATAQVMGVAEDQANLSAGTITVVSAFTAFESGETLTFSYKGHDGSLGTLTSVITSSDTGADLVSWLNANSATTGFVASWTSGEGLALTNQTAGASESEALFSDASGNTYVFSTSESDGSEGTDESYGSVTIHFGTGNDATEDYYSVQNQNMTASGLGIADLSIASQESAQAALETLDDAIIQKDEGRAHFGAMMNRLENTVTNLTIQSENIQAAESQISDVDVAFEMTNFMNLQVKAQAAIAMLAQANSLPQLATRLLG